MRLRDVFETTSNNAVYKKAMKKLLDREGVVCSECPYHKGGNASKDLRSWKKHRSQQYKVK
jgi:hypothetical protein